MSASASDAAAPQRGFSDTWNPILVKELRAALRGRYFRVLFPLTLLVATAVAVLQLVDGIEYRRDRAGIELFQGVFVCLLLAVNGLVPFAAFLNMGHEWEEHTYDLLVLSKLKPRQIVFGKLLSVGVEALLYVSAFAPFLVFAFLLRGIGIETIVMLLAGALVASASCSAVAMALSSLSRARSVRVVLLVLLGGILIGANAAMIGFSSLYVRNPDAMSSPGEWLALVTTFVGIAIPGVLALGVASSSLAHAEENASTVPRIVVTAVLVVVAGLLVGLFVTSPSGDVPEIAGAILTIGVTLCDLFFASEPERLTLRAREQTPRSPLGALLAFPFLPGGARGLALLALHFALILATTFVLTELGAAAAHYSHARFVHAVHDVALLQVFCFAYVAIPTLLFASRSTRPGVRIFTRVLVPVGALLSMFVPALVGFLVGERDWVEMKHAFDPFWVAFGRSGGGTALDGFVFAAGALVVLANAPRLQRAVTDVLDASRVRRRAAQERSRAA